MNNRNKSINYVKLLACFSVVMLHCGFPGVVGKVLYGWARFAVPMFFIISGYFVYNADRKIVYKKLPFKIIHIALLLFATEVIYFIWHCFQYYIESGITGVSQWIYRIFTWEAVLKLFVFQTSLTGDVSWFLVALLLCYIATYIIAETNAWMQIGGMAPILILINLFIGEIAPFLGFSTPWYYCSNFWTMGLPFFSAGFMLKIYQKQLNRISDRALYITLFFSLGLNVLERIVTNASQLFLSNAFIAIALFILAVRHPYIKSLSGTRAEKVMDFIGDKLAFYVYIMHPIVRDILKLLVIRIGSIDNSLYLWGRPLIVFFMCLLLGTFVVGFIKVVHK